MRALLVIPVPLFIGVAADVTGLPLRVRQTLRIVAVLPDATVPWTWTAKGPVTVRFCVGAEKEAEGAAVVTVTCPMVVPVAFLPLEVEACTTRL